MTNARAVDLDRMNDDILNHPAEGEIEAPKFLTGRGVADSRGVAFSQANHGLRVAAPLPGPGEGLDRFAPRRMGVVEQTSLPPPAPRPAPPLSEAAEKLMAEVDLKRVEALRDQQNAMCDAAVAQAVAEQARWKAWGETLVEQTRKGIEERARIHAAQRAFFEGAQALADQHGIPLPSPALQPA